MREVFVFGSEPGAPEKKRRLNKSSAERAHATLKQLLNTLLKVEEQIDVDLDDLYKMRTIGTRAEDEALESWPSTLLTVLQSKFSIEDDDEKEIVNLFSIGKKDDAFFSIIWVVFLISGMSAESFLQATNPDGCKYHLYQQSS